MGILIGLLNKRAANTSFAAAARNSHVDVDTDPSDPANFSPTPQYAFHARRRSEENDADAKSFAVYKGPGGKLLREHQDDPTLGMQEINPEAVSRKNFFMDVKGPKGKTHSIHNRTGKRKNIFNAPATGMGNVWDSWVRQPIQRATHKIKDPNTWEWVPFNGYGDQFEFENGEWRQKGMVDSDERWSQTWKDSLLKDSSYTLQSVPTGGRLDKSASQADETLVKQCDAILDTIYKENPDYWPWGLSREMFERTPGSELHLVLDKKASTPVGFVGWYEIPKGLRKVGYYSIGVLPEHRNSGFAKEAVSKMVAARAHGVDEVRAMVRESNAPSNALARVLNIPVERI